MKNNINLNSSELSECRYLFNEHYKLENGKDLNDSITINWSVLKDVIQNDSGISLQNEIVLRFIHRLSESKWFLTMECCHINRNGLIDFVGNRYDIKDFSITKSDFTRHYDSLYQHYVTYDGKSLEKLSSVKSVTFPWEQELVAAARVNKVDLDDSINLKIVSASYEYDEKGILVKYPHLLAMFFSSNVRGDMVDDTLMQSEGLIKQGKAFNRSTPCPPCCDSYELYELFFNYQTADAFL